MSFELRFPPDTRTEIADYVAERFEGRQLQEAATEAILAELEKLATNPGLGSARYGGPFESRLIYRFGINVGSATRYVEAAYKVHRKDRIIVVSGFRPLAL